MAQYCTFQLEVGLYKSKVNGTPGNYLITLPHRAATWAHLVLTATLAWLETGGWASWAFSYATFKIHDHFAN